MQTVYWSPWYPYVGPVERSELYTTQHLLYDEPISLMQELKKNNDFNTHGESWLKCHAFLGSIKNTYVLKFPIDVTFALHKDFGVIDLQVSDESIILVANKKPTIENQFTFAILNNWIFWSETPLTITSSPAFLHKSPYDGFYVPGSFDIGSWFRPLEAAIQLNEGVNTVSINRGDSMAYVKFHTDEQVQLKRFFMTPEIQKISQDCIHFKRHESHKGLPYLYSKFRGNGLHKALTKEIKKNLMEDK